MAPVADGRPPLLLHLTSDRDEQRYGVAPALAALGEQAGWVYESYTDTRRGGRHFGGGDPTQAPPGHAAGSLVLGGGHADMLAALTSRYSVAALGDPDGLLWPVLRSYGVEELCLSTDPASLFRSAAERLGVPLPDTVAVIDSRPQGAHGVVVAPYLAPRVMAEGVLAVEVGIGREGHQALLELGARRFVAWRVEPGRAADYPGDLQVEDHPPVTTYAATTAQLARDVGGWGRGVLLGDPELVAAHVPKMQRLRLVPLHGRPQVDVLEQAGDLVRQAADPVYGRQWDDRDFFALGALGRGLQVIDPAPPFDAWRTVPAAPRPAPPPADAPAISDGQLETWADEGRVLTTLLLWSGMVRELECAERLVDLVASTSMRAGLLITVDTVEHAPPGLLAALDAPPWRGGVNGQLELLLSSTGRGVAAEALVPDLAALLGTAHERIVELTGRRLDGWWPLLDTELVPAPAPRVGRRGRRPVVYFTPRGEPTAAVGDGGRDPRSTPTRDLRSVVGQAVRRSPLRHLVEVRRPFDAHRPGPLAPAVVDAVKGAGFTYMWTKAAFGGPSLAARQDDFVALPFTAGNWDGWSPFYTVGSEKDVLRAERRLLATGSPGWLVSNIDGPLWAMTAEAWEHGTELHRITSVLAQGGRSGELVNVAPSVVARYARLLDDRTRRTGG